MRRRAEPHHRLNRGGRWYLLGWALDRGDWRTYRTYRADRMTPTVPTGPRSTPREVPGGDAAGFLAARAKGSVDGADAWPCTGTVELALPAARVVPFAGDGTVEALGPDRCRLTLGAWSWAGWRLPSPATTPTSWPSGPPPWRRPSASWPSGARRPRRPDPEHRLGDGQSQGGTEPRTRSAVKATTTRAGFSRGVRYRRP